MKRVERQRDGPARFDEKIAVDNSNISQRRGDDRCSGCSEAERDDEARREGRAEQRGFRTLVFVDLFQLWQLWFFETEGTAIGL